MYKKGFTLIELLVVIAIIGILAGVLIISMVGATNSANDTRRKADLSQLVKAIVIIKTQDGSLPVEPNTNCKLGSTVTEESCSGIQSRFLLKGMVIPKDPVSGNYYTYNRVSADDFTLASSMSDSSTYTYSSATSRYSSNSLLSGWSKRKSISINNSSGSALTDYQILLDIIYDADMQTDFDDIRFTDSSISTILPYWVESKTNSSTAKVWVKIPSIPTSGTTIYLYYGNSSVGSISNISNIFIREINGLQGAWSMDETSGTVANDYSGNNNNGSTIGASTISGKFGNAKSFNGDSQYIDIGNPSIFNFNGSSNSFSIEAWVYKNSDKNNNSIVYKQGTANSGLGYGISGEASGKFIFAMGKNNVGANIVYSSLSYPINTWHHIVGAFDAISAKMNLYINGSYIGQTSYTYGSISSDKKLYIGSDQDSVSIRTFNGVIDEVKIYNKALSASEIIDLYSNYGYVAIRYLNKVLVRKYVASGPTISFGSEQSN